MASFVSDVGSSIKTPTATTTTKTTATTASKPAATTTTTAKTTTTLPPHGIAVPTGPTGPIGPATKSNTNPPVVPAGEPPTVGVGRPGIPNVGPPPPRTPKPPPSPGGDTDADRFLAGAVGLSHAAAFAAIEAGCDLYGIEDKAACADGLHEGFHGGIGDGGTAYGPWQEHLTDGRIPEIAGLDPNDHRVQEWAWSAKGIEHGIRGMAVDTPSARNLRGHAAVHAIVYGFERPRDEAGAYATRAAEYDHLEGMGAGWRAYVISNLVGPGLPGTTTAPYVPPFQATETQPTGASNAWQGLMHTLGTTLPGLGVEARRVGRNLPGV